VLAAVDGGLAGIVGAIGEPHGEDFGADGAADFDAIEGVVKGELAGPGIGRAEGAELVELVLEDVGVNGTDFDALLAGEGGDVAGVLTCLEVPQDVHGDSGAAAGEFIDEAGVVELFLEGGGGGGLEEFAETGAGIGKAPRGQFNLETVQGGEKLAHLAVVHWYLRFRSQLSLRASLTNVSERLVQCPNLESRKHAPHGAGKSHDAI